MTLNQLQYFYQAAKTQHFNHAANNLRISQPSLCYAVSPAV
ncbi:MAG: LysR family transcriptional regulator [Lachnospiraceae bacterium]|nr:LysR family transcriptional regulator [Lachnospiraceae bacterium]